MQNKDQQSSFRSNQEANFTFIDLMKNPNANQAIHPTSSYPIPMPRQIPSLIPTNNPNNMIMMINTIHPAEQPTIPSNTRSKYEKKTKQQEQEEKQFNERYYKGKKMDFGEVSTYYNIKSEIGRGAYGVVYKAYLLDDNKNILKKYKYAIKALFGTVTETLIHNELCFLKLVNGQYNTPYLRDAYFTNYQYFIITDYFKYHTIDKYLFTSSMIEIKHYMYELLTSLCHLENLGILHRDIKQGNFLYNMNTRKGILIDFGLAELSKEKITQIQNESKSKKPSQNWEIYEMIRENQRELGERKIGTEGFMPLDQIMVADYQSYEIDIWSAGVIFLEFLTRKHPFFRNPRMRKVTQASRVTKNINEIPQVEYLLIYLIELSYIYGTKKVKKISETFGYSVELPSYLPEGPTEWKDIVIHPEFDDLANDLLSKMLKLEPRERIKAREALSHSFFDEIRKLKY